MRSSAVLAAIDRSFPGLPSLPRDCFLVGGAIRDSILGVPPKDLDIVCDDAAARAKTFATLTGGRIVEIGREPMTIWRVIAGEETFDFSELPSSAIGAELLRRDFTLNAIAIHLGRKELVDPAGGIEDLERRLLRMIAPKNFSDDPLRVLRGVRLACQIGLTIDGGTFTAMRHHSALLQDVARERVGYELESMLSSPRPALAVTLVRQLDLGEFLFGLPLTIDTERAMERESSGDLVVRLTILFRDDPQAANHFVDHWCLGRSLQKDLESLLELDRRWRESNPGGGKVALHDAGEKTARRFRQLLASTGDDTGLIVLDSILQTLRFAERPLLDGEQIGRLAGLAEGPEVGRIKRALLVAQLRGEISGVEEATEFVRRWRDA